MSIRKWLVKMNNRLESNWSLIDTSADSINLKGGWYVTEYLLKGAVYHAPRLIIQRSDQEDFDRVLTCFHTGRNRVLLSLPQGQLKAYSQSIEFIRLAKIPGIEGRARVLLVCGRYLLDFFSLRVLLSMIVMQFRNRLHLSTRLLTFYAPVPFYLQNVIAWGRYSRFSTLLSKLTTSWLTKGAKIAVVIEAQAQRKLLGKLLVAPDYVLNIHDALPADVDYVIPLGQQEHLYYPAILMLKLAIRKAKIKPSLIYTDHDYQFDETAGQHVMAPVLKPEPSLTYLHCFNYIGPAVVFSRALIQGDPLSELFNDEYRYQVAIDCFGEVAKVLHVSETLFTSERQESLQTPAPNSLESAWPGVQWQRRDDYNVLLPAADWREYPSVDLVIPTRDGLSVLKPCIDSLLSITDYPDFTIIIVDNGSEQQETHDFFAQISNDERVSVIEFPGEFNYSAINNFAVSQGNSQYIALINNDIEVIHADWLKNMMIWAIQPEVGIVGAKLLFGNGLVQHAGVTIGMGNAAGHIHRLEKGNSPGYQNRCIATQNMMAVTAACLVTPRVMYEELGGLNERQFKIAYNDIDYCLRIEALGKHVIWTPEARLFHHESVSRGDDMSNEHVERYFRELKALQKRWKTKGFVDKYYSRYLRRNDEGVYPQLMSAKPGELFYVGSVE